MEHSGIPGVHLYVETRVGGGGGEEVLSKRSRDVTNETNVTEKIKTITKFSKVIGYQQPDLSINWTPSVRVILVIGQYASFCARSVLWSTLLSKLLGFSALITAF